MSSNNNSSIKEKNDKNKSMKSLLLSFQKEFSLKKASSSSSSSSSSTLQKQEKEAQNHKPIKENKLIYHLRNNEWLKAEEHLRRIPGEASYTYPIRINNNEEIRLFPLHYACTILESKKKNEIIPHSIIKELIRADMDICKCKDVNSRLPLHYACENKQDKVIVSVESIEYIINRYPKGLIVKESLNDFLPLHLACCFHNIKYDLDEGQNQELIQMAKDRSIQLVKILIQYYEKAIKIKEKYNGWLPLHIACKTGAPIEIIQYLLNAFPSAIYEKDMNGRLPIHLACGSRNYFCTNNVSDVITLLTTYYLKGIWDREEKYGFLPLHIACNNSTLLSSPQGLDLIHTLISYNPSSMYAPSTNNGSTPLHVLCRVGGKVSYKMIQTFLFLDTKKKSVKCFDVDKRLPLHWACHSITGLCSHGVQLLINAYPNAVKIPEKKYGYLPLHVVCASLSLSGPVNNIIGIIHILLSSYPLANCYPASNGNLPIHILCENTKFIDPNVLRALISYNPNLCKFKNKQGMTPSMIINASKYKHHNKSTLLSILGNEENIQIDSNTTSMPSLFLPIPKNINKNKNLPDQSQIIQKDQEDDNSPRDVTQLFPIRENTPKQNNEEEDEASPSSLILNYNNLSKCAYCMIQPATNILYPCGHPCFCDECKKLHCDSRNSTATPIMSMHCPKCHSSVRDIIHVRGNVLGSS